METMFLKRRKIGYAKHRALLAEGPGIPTLSQRATATFRFRDRKWVCVSASKGLKFLVGMADKRVAKQLLDKMPGVKWHWL